MGNSNICLKTRQKNHSFDIYKVLQQYKPSTEKELRLTCSYMQSEDKRIMTQCLMIENIIQNIGPYIKNKSRLNKNKA